MLSTVPQLLAPRRRASAALAILLIGFSLTWAGCTRSGSQESLPHDVTVDSPRAARLAGSWIGFGQSINAPFEFVSATFETRGDYTAVIYAGWQQTEQKGRWLVAGDELVLDGKQRWELEFRGTDMVVLRDPEARVMHQLARKK